MFFEVVLENSDEILMAQKYGAKRVELCSALDLGGLTPSPSMIELAAGLATCEVHTMIRPRGGGFIYNDSEIGVMKKDIAFCKNAGCAGVVFGLVDRHGKIDAKHTKMLTEFSKALGLEVTFHRAVDFTPNLYDAMETLIGLGLTRVLTSGGKPNVDEGVGEIKNLYSRYGSQIQVMAGGGVNVSNAAELIGFGLRHIHFNLRRESAFQSNLLMGKEYEIDEEKIRQITALYGS